MYLREYMRQYRSSYYQQHVLPARMAARAALVADSNNNGNSNNSNGNSIAASSGNSSGSDSGPENRTTDSSTIRASSIMEVSDSSASTSASSAWSSFSSSKAVKATSSSSFSSSSDSSDSADSSHACGLEGIIISSSQTSSIRMTPPHTCTHKAEFAFPSSGRPQPRKPTMMPSFPSRSSRTSGRLSLLTSFAPSNSNSDVGKSRDVRRQELLTSLETAFSSLAEVESGVADLAPTKLLLKTVVQARMCLETFDPSGRDVKLTFEVFNLALHKLSPGLRAQFLSIYCPSSPHCLTPGASLQSMVSFLQAEIVTQHAKSVWLITRNREENGDGIPLTPVDPLTTTPYCRYCKTTGHLYEHCLNVRQLLCFQCYEEGHTKRNCPYRVPVYRF